MKKEPRTKFFGVDQFHSVMKLQSFEFDVSDVILADLEITHLVFYFEILLLISCRRNLLQKFMMFLVFFHKLTKLTKLRWIKLCLGVNDVMMRIILHDISIAHHKKKKSIVLACKLFD